MSTRTDEELMRAYQGGENAAFRALFERYAGRLLGATRRKVRNEDDCQEIVQQTFLNLHRARKDFRDGNKVRPWLYTICLNLRREYFRRRGRRPEAPLELDGRQDPVEPPYDPVKAEQLRQVRTAVGALAASQRDVIELHWFEGLSYPEVAEILGLGLSATKVRAHRGYRVLRETIGQLE